MDKFGKMSKRVEQIAKSVRKQHEIPVIIVNAVEGGFTTEPSDGKVYKHYRDIDGVGDNTTVIIDDL